MNRLRAPLMLAIAIAIAVAIAIAGPQQAGAADGKEVFLAQKCNLCHSVESAAIPRKTDNEKTNGPELTGLAERHDAEWVGKFLKREIQKDGKAHKKEYKGTDEELKALVDWLLAQKKA